MGAGAERSSNKRTMAADPTSRDDPLPEKKKKVVDLGSDSDEDLPNPSQWAGVNPDSFGDDYLAKMEKARLDEESAPRPVKIATLDYYKPATRFHTIELFPVFRSGSKAVLLAAKFLLGISSSRDGEPLRRCSGFWVDWDEEKKTGLVLTTARLIRTKDAPYSVWSGGEEYATDADVTVHLLNGTSAKGQLVYLQPHYDLAFLSVQEDQRKKYQHIARPHLGMMFKDIKLLEPAHVDMLWRMFNIDDGLIVQEVSGGSPAEKFGIQKGDIIESFNGKHVSSTIELENTLMSIYKGTLDAEVRIFVVCSK
ncbi:uncharacterized protein [Triticum aestivum]|uniref:uncharacterized protein n=1 Tax=Triticum aestivum TaxID=4565 RepID=UPI001D02709F|nr:uncharacterized protein LOC123106231 [Triticum aestivum]